MTYSIHESLIDKLEQKLTTIRNKCEKYGCEFHYERVGEEYKEVEDEGGVKILNKYIIVEADGKAIVNNWRFVATIEHTDSGNVIRQYDFDVDVPSKYRTAKPVCEHCNTLRNRNDTYLVYNDTIKEFKQVGKSCLKDFTNGLDAEQVARFMSYEDLLEEYQRPETLGKHRRRYYPLKDVLMYGIECIKHFGYRKADQFDVDSTGLHTYELYRFVEFGFSSQFKSDDYMQNEIDEYNFKAITDENSAKADEMIEWVLNSSDTSNYIQNLKVLVNNKYITRRDVNFVVSLVPSYYKYVSHVRKVAADKEQSSKSEYVGKIKDKLSIEVKEDSLVTSWDTMYGTQFMYKFVDSNDNIFIWITSVLLDSRKVVKVNGTVKDHSEYNGAKQTVLTRCKVEYEPEAEEIHPEGTFDLSVLDVMEGA